MTALDPVAFTQALVRCPSVTPEAGPALDLLETALTRLGFRCTRIGRGGVDNLYARWGRSDPVFAFAGHVDTVPVGDPASWTVDPFSGAVRGDRLFGRGACDMKSAVAAFVSAAAACIAEPPQAGSILLLITGDEEGPATDGTAAILDWMRAAGERADFCLVGEPTGVARVGDTVKIGRRGSMTGALTVFGTQGHTAYPERAVNPLPVLARIATRLAETPLDLGSTHFQASSLALTSLDTGNPASNVIPATARARFNIRFNDQHSSDSIEIWADQLIEAVLDGTGCTAELEWEVSGQSFVTPPGPETDLVVEAVTQRLLERPMLSTGGGTSDARFIKDFCPVLELGLTGDTMHAADESVSLVEIQVLAEIYGDILRRFFPG